MILATKNFGAPPAISDAPRTPPSQPNSQRNMLLTSCHMLHKSCTSKRVTAASWRSATSNTTGSFRLLHARWHFEPVNSMKRPSSSTRWWRLLLVAALVTAAVVASDVQGQAVAAVDSAAETTTSQVASSEEKAEVPEFVATHEWQELLPGQGIPRGLHVRLNLETGKREAKLVDPDDVVAEEEMRSVVVDPNNNKEATVTVSTDISGEIVPVDADDELIAVPEESADLEISEEENLDGDSVVGEEVDGVEGDEEDETNWNHEKIYEVLQALPEPPQVDGMDIHDAHDKLSPAEFRQQMITLWKKRQIELKEAMESIEDDSKYFARLLDQFYEAEKKEDIPEMLNILEVLEYEVQDLDKTLVFNFIGGFGVMAEYLNSTILPVRAHAAWVVGSAAKNFYDAQNWAIDAGAVPKLISTLNLKVEDDTAAIVEAKKKALYALSAIVRSNERGQRLFLLHSGPDAIAELSNEIYPVNMQQKTLLLAFDLVVESYDHELSEEQKANLVQLRGLFYSTEWCHRFSSFFVAHGSQLPARQAIEMMDALRYQLPACQSVFDAADVKGAVATVGTALATDEEEFDEEERAELALFLEDVQQRLTAGSA